MSLSTMSQFEVAACKSIRDALKRKFGSGWQYLGEEIQSAMVAQAVLHSFTGRDDDSSIRPQMLSNRLIGVREAMGMD